MNKIVKIILIFLQVTRVPMEKIIISRKYCLMFLGKKIWVIVDSTKNYWATFAILTQPE